MLREVFVAFVSAALLLVGCGDDDGGVSMANDQAAADQAVPCATRSGTTHVP
jgi:hypothetical protein